MNGTIRKIGNKIGGGWLGATLLPSFFDLACGMFLVSFLFIKGSTAQSTLFIFGTITLICITFMLKPKRSYTSVPLALLALWSLLGIFTHSFVIPNEKSIVMKYINMYLMSEGFIYILFGILLLFSIRKYASSSVFLSICVLVSAFPLIKEMFVLKRISSVMAFGISIMIYLLMKKKFVIFLILFLVISTLIFANWKWVAMKYQCRPVLWKFLIDKEISKHPFIGNGFNKTIAPDNMVWIYDDKGPHYGWLYNQNDYLNITSALGIPVLIFILWFIASSILKIGPTPILIGFMAIAILCFWQITMFLPHKAAICIAVMGLSIKRRLV